MNEAYSRLRAVTFIVDAVLGVAPLILTIIKDVEDAEGLVSNVYSTIKRPSEKISSGSVIADSSHLVRPNIPVQSHKVFSIIFSYMYIKRA